MAHVAPRTTLIAALTAGFLAGVVVCAVQPAVSAPAASTAAQIKALQKQVTGLTSQVKALKQGKADRSDVSQVASGVIVATTTMQGVTQATSNLQVGLTALQASLSGITKVIELKANSSDVALKADKDAVQALGAKVAALCAAQPAICSGSSSTP